MYHLLYHGVSCAASWFLISHRTDFNEAFAERSLNEALLAELNCRWTGTVPVLSSTQWCTMLRHRLKGFGVSLVRLGQRVKGFQKLCLRLFVFALASELHHSDGSSTTWVQSHGGQATANELPDTYVMDFNWNEWFSKEFRCVWFLVTTMVLELDDKRAWTCEPFCFCKDSHHVGLVPELRWQKDGLPSGQLVSTLLCPTILFVSTAWTVVANGCIWLMPETTGDTVNRWVLLIAPVRKALRIIAHRVPIQPLPLLLWFRAFTRGLQVLVCEVPWNADAKAITLSTRLLHMAQLLSQLKGACNLFLRCSDAYFAPWFPSTDWGCAQFASNEHCRDLFGLPEGEQRERPVSIYLLFIYLSRYILTIVYIHNENIICFHFTNSTRYWCGRCHNH